MAARASTLSKKRHVENVLFWAAQQQALCPHCRKPLLPTGRNSDVYGVTFDHHSGAYDHVKRVDVKPKGGTFMHRTCHKSKTMTELRIWEHRKK